MIDPKIEAMKAGIRERDIERALAQFPHLDRELAEHWLEVSIYAHPDRHRRWNAEGMPGDTPAQRVYKALILVQLRFQEDGDEAAHDLLCDHVLDAFRDRFGGELS